MNITLSPYHDATFFILLSSFFGFLIFVFFFTSLLHLQRNRQHLRYFFLGVASWQAEVLFGTYHFCFHGPVFLCLRMTEVTSAFCILKFGNCFVQRGPAFGL